MIMKGNQKSKNRQNDCRDASRNVKSNSKPQKRGAKSKKTEIDIPDSDINVADLGIRGRSRKDNDVSWYAKNEALLRDSASFAYGIPLGTAINSVPQANFSQFGGTTISATGLAKVIPGVCAVHFVPTIGMSDDTYSAANLAARNIYSFVRHANSGSANYDSPDLMMYLLATDSCFSFYAMMVRAYGLMRTYSATNRYLPKVLVESMRLNYNDLMTKLAEFRYFINQYAVKLGSLCVPGDMSYIERHIWMNSYVYTDSASWKAQNYLYVQDAFYTFVEQTEGPGYLEYTDWVTNSGSNMGLNEIIAFANALIEPLLASEDIGIMSGDILKAFGRDNLFYVNMIAEDYTVLPAYSAEVLSQIENTIVLGEPSASTTLSTYSRNITQDVTGPTAGAIRQHFFWEVSATTATPGYRSQIAALALPRILNMHKDEVSAGDTMVATRMMNIVTQLGYSTEPSPGYAVWEVEQCGSEICVSVEISYIVPGAARGRYNLNTYGIIVPTTQASITQAALASFDWAPQFAVVYYQSSGSQVQGYTTDFDNYTVLTSNDLTRMHDAALLSEFDVPQMARLSGSPTR